MRVIFMGTPDFGVPTLEALHKSGHEIVAVYSGPDRQAGRGRRPRSSPVKEKSVDIGLPVLQPTTLRGPGQYERIAGYKPDSIVVAAYRLMLPAEVLQAPRLGCVNLHPSLLPRHRGATPIPATILANDDNTGVSVILLNERMDAGAILGQQIFPVNADDTTESLGRRLAVTGSELVIDVLRRQERGDIEPVRQDESQATFTRQLKKSDGLIDWNHPAEYIARMVRAYYRWPGAFSYWWGKSIKLVKARAEEVTGWAPGEVAVSSDGQTLLVGTGYGHMVVERVQMEGRKEMAASDFIRGNQAIDGERLG